MNNIKKGDNIIVIAGKDKGKRAKVVRVLSSGKLLIEGAGEVKKRRRPKKAGEKGQVVTMSMPMDSSNVAHFCPTCKKGVRREHKHDK